MAKKLLPRRGSAVAHAEFIGDIGEITVDLTNHSVVVHDGETPGGWDLKKDLFSKQSLMSVQELKSYRVNKFDLGTIVSISSYYPNSPLGGGKWKVVNTSSVTVNDIDVIRSSYDGVYSYILQNESPINAYSYGVGDVSDSSIRLQRAIDRAVIDKISTVHVGSFTHTSSVLIKTGVKLIAIGSKFGPRYWGSGLFTSWQYVNESAVIKVVFGEGNADDYSKSGFIMQSGSSVSGFAFYYPLQNMTASTPTVYSPTIALEYRAGSTVTDASTEDVNITDINLGNAYVGIDARRAHSQVKVERINGYPLFRGIRIGSTEDNDYVKDVHFARLNVFRGGIVTYENLLNYVNLNGKGLEIGRSSWGHFENIFCFGYRNTVYAYYQDSSLNTQYSRSGGVQKGTFINIGGDLCKYTAEFDNRNQNGVIVTGVELHWGVDISINSTPAGETAGRTIPPNISDTACFIWNGMKTTGGNRYFNASITCWGGVGQIAIIDGARNGKLTVNGYSWNSNNAMAYAAAVVLRNTENCTIMPGSFFDCQNRDKNYGVLLDSNNVGVTVTGISSMDYGIDGGGVKINASSNSFYRITENTFISNISDVVGVVDLQMHDKSQIHSNIDSANSYILFDSDVVNGVLNLPYQGENNLNLFRYQGTTTIKGISGARRGYGICIHFTNVCTIFHASTEVSAPQRLYLPNATNITTSAYDMLQLGGENTGWNTVGYSAN